MASKSDTLEFEQDWEPQWWSQLYQQALDAGRRNPEKIADEGTFAMRNRMRGLLKRKMN